MQYNASIEGYNNGTGVYFTALNVFTDLGLAIDKLLAGQGDWGSASADEQACVRILRDACDEQWRFAYSATQDWSKRWIAERSIEQFGDLSFGGVSGGGGGTSESTIAGGVTQAFSTAGAISYSPTAPNVQGFQPRQI